VYFLFIARSKMKLTDQKSFILSVILAVVGFVVVDFALGRLALKPALLFGAGLLIGAIAIDAISADVNEEAEVES
ncbi:hypothetical protein R0J93_28900, partial [Pseudoalteromonas sp. SIMBA_148]